MLSPLQYMTLLGPPYFVYSCERREFVFAIELELLGMANLCTSAFTLFTLLESFFLWYYFRCLFVRSFDSSLIFLSFSFVVNFIFLFIIFLAGRNY